MQNEWRDFNGGAWENEVNVRDFIQRNYKPYDGDSSFLEDRQRIPQHSGRTY